MPTLLAEIHRGLPTELRARLGQLHQKSEHGTLGSDEQAELLGLVAQVEALEVERIQNLMRLADIRGMSLTALMDQLKIRSPENG